MNKLEHNAVLAGLRLLQANLQNLPEGICGIFNDGGMNTMKLEDIDALCEQINANDLMVIAVGNPFDGLRLIGPFHGGAEASDYADQAWHEGNSEPFHIVRLDEPEEGTN